MLKLSLLLIACTALAYLSEQKTLRCARAGVRYRPRRDPAYILLMTILVLFAGLRTSYNDTWNYVSAFRAMGTLAEFWESPDSQNVFKNPLFYLFERILREWTDNAQWLIFLTSLFTQVCFVRFFKRYSSHFMFSIFIYITFGTYCFSLAAIKQVVAMAVTTLAFPYLQEKKYLRYWFVIFLAMLIHTYALAFAILPFFRQRPWSAFTYLFVAVMVVVMLNFEENISAFMEQANDLGKSLADYEVFDDNTINLLRLAVYAVAPLITLVFRKKLFRDAKPMENVLAHMSIISLAFMVMGTQSGANMFARMGTYFELGTICILPWMLEKALSKQTYRLIAGIAIVCFLGYFLYAFGINADFSQDYQATSIFALFR